MLVLLRAISQLWKKTTHHVFDVMTMGPWAQKCADLDSGFTPSNKNKTGKEMYKS